MKKIKAILTIVLTLCLLSVGFATPKVTTWTVNSSNLTSNKIDLKKGKTPNVNISFTRDTVSGGKYEDVYMEIQFYVLKDGKSTDLQSILITNSNFYGSDYAGSIYNRYIGDLSQYNGGTLLAKYRTRKPNSIEYNPYINISKSYQIFDSTPKIPQEVKAPSGYTTIYRLFNTKIGKHMISRKYSQVVDLIQGGDWVYEHVLGFISSSKIANTTELYSYYSTKYNDHYYSTSSVIPEFYIKENIIGYVYSSKVNNSIPIHGYFKPTHHDHVYSKNFSELGDGKLGYIYEGIRFYVIQYLP